MKKIISIILVIAMFSSFAVIASSKDYYEIDFYEGGTATLLFDTKSKVGVLKNGESIDKYNIVITVDNPDIARVSYDKTTSEISVRGLKYGSTTFTIKDTLSGAEKTVYVTSMSLIQYLGGFAVSAIFGGGIIGSMTGLTVLGLILYKLFPWTFSE